MITLEYNKACASSADQTKNSTACWRTPKKFKGKSKLYNDRILLMRLWKSTEITTAILNRKHQRNKSLIHATGKKIEICTLPTKAHKNKQSEPFWQKKDGKKNWLYCKGNQHHHQRNIKTAIKDAQEVNRTNLSHQLWGTMPAIPTEQTLRQTIQKLTLGKFSKNSKGRAKLDQTPNI